MITRPGHYQPGHIDVLSNTPTLRAVPDQMPCCTIRSGIPRWYDAAIRTVPLTESIILIHPSPALLNDTVLHLADPHSLAD